MKAGLVELRLTVDAYMLEGSEEEHTVLLERVPSGESEIQRGGQLPV